jgi:hypothetical protein
MQELLQNKAIVALIAVAALALIWTIISGGFSGGSGDLPTLEGTSAGTTTASAPPATTPSASTTPTPTTGSTTTQSTPAAAPAGAGTSTGTVSTPSTSTSSSGTSGGTTPPATLPPGSTGGDTGINEKLQAFRNLYPEDIIEKKYNVLEEEVTKPENFAEDIGRVDPLTVVNDFIPEELRPPREGETSDEEMFKFMEEAVGYEILNSIEIQVIEVLQVGNYNSVVCLINGQGTNMAEGDAVGANGVTIQASKVTRGEVVFTLSYVGDYASVSKTKSFISGSY